MISITIHDSVSGTFSIVAVDVEEGLCGAAVASMFPAVGKVVPHVRSKVGAFCTQHHHKPEWGPLALDLLEQGHLPEVILGQLLKDDDKRDKRQLGIVDMQGRTANRNPSNADASGIWWGGVTGRYYACQGNSLAGGDVISAMAIAFEKTWRQSLGERLIAALCAGDQAGGDHRGRLAAGLRLTRPESDDDGLLLLDVDDSNTAVMDLANMFKSIFQ